MGLAIGTLLLLVLSTLAIGPVSGGGQPSAPAASGLRPLAPNPGERAVAAAAASIQAGHGPAQVLSSFRAAPIPGASPSIGGGLSMVYDAADGYVLAVTINITGSGNTSGWGSVVQTWTFSAGNWSELNLSYAPPNRDEASAVYDPLNGCAVLFGGERLGGSYGSLGPLNDTWTFTGGTWTNLTGNLTQAPTPRAGSPMVWDGGDHYALLVGGFGTSGNLSGNLSEVWTFVNGSWTKVGSAPGLRPEGAMAYDAADGYVLYFGGSYPTYLTNETWKYRAGTWTSISSNVTGAPAARVGAAMVYDPGLGGVLLFGGLGEPTTDHYLNYNDTWLYHALNWTLLSPASGPSPREYAHLAFDAGDNVTVLFGGYNFSYGTYSDTWALGPSGNASSSNGTGWAQAAPHLRASLANDEVGVPVALTAGGVQGSNATFSYAGLPLGCTTEDVAVLSCTPLQIGNYTIVLTVNSYAGSAAATILLHVVSPPTISAVGVSPALTEVGGTITVSALVQSGVPPFQYQYTGLPTGCAGASSAAFSCTVGSTGSFTIGVAATDSLGVIATGSTSLEVRPAVAVAGVGLSPEATDAGQSVTISPTIQGGLGPFIYAYPVLPQGCSSANRSAIRCSPSAPGNVSVEATVTDWLGFSAHGYGQLIVNPAPVVREFSAANESIPVNGTLVLSVVLAGGTAPYAYFYTGLPAGCASENRSTLTCVPMTAGNYSLGVEVTDAVGVTVTASATVAVAPAPIQPSPGGHSGNTGGPGTGGSTSSAASTVYFFTGLTLGLVALAAGLSALLWRARLAREGRDLVEQLRYAKEHGGEGDLTGSGDPPTGPRGAGSSEGPRGDVGQP